MSFYCYLLECADGSYYCGWTTNLESRLKKHLAGEGSRYTRMKGPVRLVYFEEVENRRAAMQREHAIKKLPHCEKKSMAEKFTNG